MDCNSDESVVSTQKKLKASQDPGWNDPPKWAYSSVPNSGSTPTKRLLNKRVAFPLNSNSIPTQSSLAHLSSSSNFLPPNLPPVETTNLTTAPHAPMLAPSSVSNEFDTSKLTIDKEKALNNSLANLQYLINNELKINVTYKGDEIQKRLEVMKSMWEEDKFSNEIQAKIFTLSEALKVNDIDKADKIHMNLMMNHGTLCNSWIPVVRYLISELKVLNKSGGCIDGNDDSEPFFSLNSYES